MLQRNDGFSIADLAARYHVHSLVKGKHDDPSVLSLCHDAAAFANRLTTIYFSQKAVVIIWSRIFTHELAPLWMSPFNPTVRCSSLQRIINPGGLCIGQMLRPPGKTALGQPAGMLVIVGLVSAATLVVHIRF